MLVRNRIFAERLVDGTDPYEDGLHAPYPLTWALFHSAFLWMPVPVERAVWCAAQLALLALWLAALDRAARTTFTLDRRTRIRLLLVAAVLTSRFWLRDMAGGGSNLVVTSLAFFGTMYVFRGHSVRGALALGASCALKLTPFLFLPYLAVRRRLGSTAVTALVAGALLLAPALVMGIDRYVDTTREWSEGVFRFLGQSDLEEDSGHIIPFEWMNQSLRNAVFRYLTDVEYDHPWYRQGLGLPEGVATWIFRALALGLLAISAWVLGHRSRDGVQPRSEDPEAAIREIARIGWVFILMLLLSPISWRAHYVSTIPAIYVVAVHAWVGMRGRYASRIVLVLFFLLASATNETFWGKGGKALLQAHYTVTIATLLLLPQLARIVLDPRAFRASSATASGTLPPSVDGSSPAPPA